MGYWSKILCNFLKWRPNWSHYAFEYALVNRLSVKSMSRAILRWFQFHNWKLHSWKYRGHRNMLVVTTYYVENARIHISWIFPDDRKSVLYSNMQSRWLIAHFFLKLTSIYTKFYVQLNISTLHPYHTEFVQELNLVLTIFGHLLKVETKIRENVHQ